MAQSEEQVEHDLVRWLEKWEYVLRTDRALAKASARLALMQLDEIVHEQISQFKDERLRG